MADSIVHRGPDDAGYLLASNLGPGRPCAFFDREELGRLVPAMGDDVLGLAPTRELDSMNYRVGLAHRRLSVLDPTAAGRQPMRGNGDTWLAYNGEVYNFRCLRSELESAGCYFRSQTDTEVVLKGYERWGISFFDRLNGMFAFALWDQARRRMILVRDSMGVKPLYVHLGAKRTAFASEVKALLSLRDQAAGLDEVALREYFTFQNTFGSRTLFSGVEMVAPGSVWVWENGTWSRHTLNMRSPRDWSGSSFSEAREEIREALARVTKRQMVADVPVCAYLSGGLDSASLTAFARPHTKRLMTFTGGFDLTQVSGFEAVFDEREDAEILAHDQRTEHYQLILRAGDMQAALPEIIHHIEDLRAGMCYPNFYTARLAGRFAKVVLSGCGGDEVFAGYPWRYRNVQDCSSHDDFVDRYFGYWTRLVPPAQHNVFFTEEVLACTRGYHPFDSFRGATDGLREIDEPFRKAIRFEQDTFLHGLLVLEDKLSMTHSLESRVPFLDQELLHLTEQMPQDWLLCYDWDQNPERDENLAGKYILRRAMEGVLPNSILSKRKQGFSPPDGSWFKGPVANYISETLMSKESRISRYIRPEAIAKVVNEHGRGAKNHRLLLWSLLSFEWWCRIFLEGMKPPSSTLALRG